jgi:uncharacterized protein (TIGR02231 family)
MTLFVISTMANEGAVVVPSKLRSATVFRRGAELVHTATAELGTGNNELLIDGISNNVEDGSIRVGCNGDVTILSATFSLEYLKTEEVTPAVKRLKDSIASVKKEQTKLNLLTASDNESLELLRANRSIRGSAGLNVTELEKMVDYYKQRSLSLLMEINGYKERTSSLDQLIGRLESQVQEEENKGVKRSGAILLRVLSTTSGKVDFTITYLTPAASWTPFYDLKADNVQDPLRLLYKARLQQTSGIDWKQIRLTLSTAIPNERNTAPQMQPWFLGFVQPFAPAMFKSSNSLDEVVVVGYGSEKRKDMLGAVKSLDDHVIINDHSLNTSFDINIPYDVPGNGKEQEVSMKETNVPCSYQYYAAPALDPNVYLLGEVPGWEKLDLLPGEANVTVEGTYIGKTDIDPSATEDTLKLTLGADKRITIKREKLTDYTSVKFLGSSKKQVFTYEITVRNNKKEKIQLLLKDQYPISTDKEIESVLLERSGAEVDEATGILSWKLDLAPGESKKFKVSYSVKYPKDKKLNLR